MMMERRSFMENVYHTEDNNYGVPSYSGGMNFEGVDPPLLDPCLVREFEDKIKEDTMNSLQVPAIQTSAIENLIKEYQKSISKAQSISQNNSLSLNFNRTSVSVLQNVDNSSSQNFHQIIPQSTPGQMSQSEAHHLTQLTELNIRNLISVLSQAQGNPTQLETSIKTQLAPSAELTDNNISERNADDRFSLSCETSIKPAQAYPVMINCTASLTPSFAHRPTFVTAGKTAVIPNTTNNQIPSTLSTIPSTVNNQSQTLSTPATTQPSGAGPSTEPPTNRFVMNSRDRHFVPDKRTKISRRNFSVSQIEGLESVYEKHRFVKRDMRRELAKRLNLSERSISYWFQNKRARSKDAGDSLQAGRS